MAGKDKEPSKMSQISQFLGSFKMGEFTTAKIARAFGVQPRTVRRVAEMNPGQCSLQKKGKVIRIIGEGGVTSKTGHNLLNEGQPTLAPLPDTKGKPRHKRSGNKTTSVLNGDS